MAGKRLTPADRIQQVIGKFEHQRKTIRDRVDRRVAALEEENAPLLAEIVALDRLIAEQKAQLEKMD